MHERRRPYFSSFFRVAQLELLPMAGLRSSGNNRLSKLDTTAEWKTAECLLGAFDYGILLTYILLSEISA